MSRPLSINVVIQHVVDLDAARPSVEAQVQVSAPSSAHLDLKPDPIRDLKIAQEYYSIWNTLRDKLDCLRSAPAEMTPDKMREALRMALFGQHYNGGLTCCPGRIWDLSSMKLASGDSKGTTTLEVSYSLSLRDALLLEQWRERYTSLMEQILDLLWQGRQWVLQNKSAFVDAPLSDRFLVESDLKQLTALAVMTLKVVQGETSK